MRTLVALTFVTLVACGPAEVRIGKAEGIPAVAGSVETDLSNFTCGMPIPAGDYTVETKKVTGGCELSFDRDVQLLKASDYQNIPSLQGGSNLVQAVELNVTRLAFTDTGVNPPKPLDLNTQVTSATISVNGQQVADKTTLARLPTKVTLTGNSLNQVKTAIDARQPCSVRTRGVIVIPEMPPPPKKMKIDYDSQPTIVVGPGQIQF